MKEIVFPEKSQATLQTAPSDLPELQSNEVTIQTVGCGICQVEIKSYRGLLDESYPKQRLGHESVGHVTRVGSNVTAFKEGDFVTTLWAPGFQEYFNVRSDWAVALDPLCALSGEKWISEPAACALNGLISANPQPADRILLLGSGYMGLLLTQIFRRSPCAEFVVSDYVEHKLELAKSLGATHTHNPSKQALSDHIAESGPYDIVIEATGAAGMISQAVNCCRMGGKVVVFADHRHHNQETVNWAPYMGKAPQILICNPGSHSDFPGIWRKSVELLKAGVFDQSNLITHKWPTTRCAEGMTVTAKPPEGFIKGYFYWE
ncbi:MAG: zinc-binding dehydrogenase [Verrucomicrobiota bacterium]